jgi:hypothetical protein
MKHEQVNNALLILAFILLIAGWACAVISFSYVLFLLLTNVHISIKRSLRRSVQGSYLLSSIKLAV